jgi:uncharacterized protein (TIGR00251 family)
MTGPASWSGSDLVLSIHAQPGARRTEVAGIHGSALKVRVSARAVEGAANEALLAFVAESFEVAKRQVALMSGATSREKRVRVTAPNRARAETVLRAWGLAQISS